MPMKCPDCGQQTIPFPDGTPCPLCVAADSGAAFLRAGRNAQAFDPVLIFEDAHGNVRFPGRNDAPTPDGFKAVELRDIRQVREFERRMNAREHARHEVSTEGERAAFSEAQQRNRAELRAAMRHMTPAGRALAQAAMDEGDRQDSQPRARFDPGFHVEVFSQDSSNRDAYRDERTDWKSRRE